MADDFELPDAEEVDDMGIEVDNEPPSAGAKEGGVEELVKGGGLQKLLVKAGEGWDTPDTGDEVKGEHKSLYLLLLMLNGIYPECLYLAHSCEFRP